MDFLDWIKGGDCARVLPWHRTMVWRPGPGQAARCARPKVPGEAASHGVSGPAAVGAAREARREMRTPGRPLPGHRVRLAGPAERSSRRMDFYHRFARLAAAKRWTAPPPVAASHRTAPAGRTPDGS